MILDYSDSGNLSSDHIRHRGNELGLLPRLEPFSFVAEDMRAQQQIRGTMSEQSVRVLVREMMADIL